MNTSASPSQTIFWESIKAKFQHVENLTEQLCGISWPKPEHAHSFLQALKNEDVGDLERSIKTIESLCSNAPELLNSSEYIHAVVALSSASQWATQQINLNPNVLTKLDLSNQSSIYKIPLSISHHYHNITSQFALNNQDDTPQLEKELRLFRHQEMLRIGLMEIRGADIQSTARDISILAKACLQAAVDHHRAKMHRQFGQPSIPCRLLVVGLGKLGGLELNLSSDIDILYLYEHDDGTVGPLSMHEFHIKLFNKISTSIHRSTAQGRVFRVDTDLRPEGKTGPIANSLAGLERYYETWGRTWERAAWIKASPVAGDLELFEDLQQLITPFVYRRYRDLEALEALFQMKQKIDAQQHSSRLRQKAYNLKLGRGGIREIEFFTQSHQLVYGGHEPHLRKSNTLEALKALEASGHINAKLRENLSDAYLFLRRVEHRAQFHEDLQTHSLPSDKKQQSTIVRTLCFESTEQFTERLKYHTDYVRAEFSNLLGSADDEPAPSPVVNTLLDQDVSEEVKQQTIIDELHVGNPEIILASLKTAQKMPGSPLHPAATETHSKIGNALVAECLLSPNTERALFHLPSLIRSLLLHGAYLEQLKKNQLRRGVARILGTSDLLTRILIASPALLSQVLSAQKLQTSEQLRIALKSRLSDINNQPEKVLTTLRQVKQEVTLQLAIAELAGEISHAEATKYLSHLAEILISCAFELAEQEMIERYGAPEDSNAAVAILVGGTLGASELGYRSDIDLSVIYIGDGETSGGQRAKISIVEYFNRIVQRLIGFLSMRLPTGELYTVDLRLRPSGSQGPLVTSLNNFIRYHKSNQAQLWERQALVRTRPIIGPQHLLARLTEALNVATYEKIYPKTGAQEIHNMRLRMADAKKNRNSKNNNNKLFNIKMDAGGLVEIEFLVQHLLLKYSHQHNSLPNPSTQLAISNLAECGLVDQHTCRQLQNAHGLLRRTLDWLRITHDEMLDHLDCTPTSLRSLAIALGYQGEDAASIYLNHIEEARTSISKAYKSTFLQE